MNYRKKVVLRDVIKESDTESYDPQFISAASQM